MQTFATTVDSHTDDIPGYLANKYKRLYNRPNDQSKLSLLEDSLECEIDERNLKEVNLITTDKLMSATQRLKPGKTDPLLEVTSDCFRGAPGILYDLQQRWSCKRISPNVYTDSDY